MSKTLQFRRGSTGLIATFAGSDGEIFIDTSKATVVVMDGATLGGNPLATETFVTSAVSRLATTSVPGTVKIDASSIVINSGVISVPAATSGYAGIVRPDGTSLVVNLGAIQLNPIQPSSFAVSGSVIMSSPYMFRNRLVNGNFQLWQRGSTTSTNNCYLADRWFGANITDYRQSTDVPANQGYAYSAEWSNSGLTYPLLSQRIPSLEAANLVSSTVTLSFWAKNIFGTSNLYVELLYPSTADLFTSTMINMSGGTLLSPTGGPTSSWGYYTYTWSSSILNTGFANGLEVRIVRDIASTSTTRIAGVQLEAGPVATPFERLPVQQQLDLCYRYAQPITNLYGNEYTTTLSTFGGLLPVPMRTTPTTNTVNISSLALAGVGAAASLASFTVNTATPNYVRFQVSHAAAGAIGVTAEPTLTGLLTAEL